ncbi:MAG: SAM-dependent methyltransferase [Firmicutes bacterium HGW-Firmicutes-2]|jgi:ubiquinone/menaquinone biosynthesis C-methylase UbiE|nr:MAG: SAM-dependent methyltransferase [Firmicutes bacterium HGW-Firmicutes-2]
MTEIELLIDFHVDAKRQGPGSEQDTLKALSFIDINPEKNLRIADIGCGSGAQTLTLAKNLNVKLTAVDLFPDFLVKLEERAKTLKLEDEISTLEKSMEDLPFSEEEYDILWSEGAIYNIGFESGIKKWKKFIKTGGYIAISELTWKTKNRPKEIEEHWNNEYPEIDTASEKIRILEEYGFSPVGFFFLSDNSWLKNYYDPMEKRFDDFLRKHGNSDAAKAIVEGEKQEIALYKKYKDYLGYGFYIAKK